MKKIILILLLLSFFDGEAQRKRRTLFDADVKTPVDSGFYGIGIIDNQAYLINHRKDSVKFKMEYPYIRAWNTGKDLAITLTRNHPTLIFAVKDSITFTLPSASDTLNKYVKYDIHYLGWRGGTGTNKYVPYDSNYRMVFSDSIRFFNSATQTTYRTLELNHLSAYNWFKLSPYRRFALEIIANKWYLTFAGFHY
ncbi:hypothetical protein [Emticicia sp.]|uniref:hypothetical protein n=1 Tax=Emticicia sp. TaxID=1930953 RepID=UPI0037516F5C